MQAFAQRSGPHTSVFPLIRSLRCFYELNLGAANAALLLPLLLPLAGIHS